MFVFSIVAFILLVLIRSIIFEYYILSATTKMHEVMSNKVLRAKILFFDSNPIGRVTTRFSKDLTILDVMVPPYSMIVTQGVMRTISVVIAVSIVNPYLLAPALIGALYMNWIYNSGIGPMVDS